MSNCEAYAADDGIFGVKDTRTIATQDKHKAQVAALQIACRVNQDNVSSTLYMAQVSIATGTEETLPRRRRRCLLVRILRRAHHPPPLLLLRHHQLARLERGGGVGLLRQEGVVEDGGAGQDVVVTDEGVVGLRREDRVVDALGLGQADRLAVDNGERVRLETRDNLDVRALSVGSGGQGAVGSDRQRGEGREGQSRVGARAGGNELRGNRVHLVEVEGSVLGAGPRRVLVDGRVEPALVARLSGEDRTGHSHVGGLGDARGGAEVGRDTDVLDDGREADKRLDVGDAKVVGAGGGGSGTERASEDSNVLGLVAGDLLNAVADPVGVAGRGEVGLGKLVEVLRGSAPDSHHEQETNLVVEGVLEVLQGQGVLEDLHVGDGGALGGGRSEGRGGEERGSGSGGLHFGWFGWARERCKECDKLVDYRRLVGK